MTGTPPPSRGQQFAFGIASTVAGRFASILLSFALTTVLLRLLGAEAYGTWSLFYLLIGYSSLFDLGLSVAVERLAARAHALGERGRIERTLNVSLTLVMLSSLAWQALLGLLPLRVTAAIGDPDVVARCLRVLPLCLAFSNAAAVVGAGLTGIQRAPLVNLLRTVVGAATTLAVMIAAAAGVRRLDVLLVLYASGLLVTAGIGWRLLARSIGPLRLRPSLERELGRELVTVGGAVQLSNLAQQLGDGALRVALGARFGPAAMGAYDVATRAALALRSMVSAIPIMMVPFGSERHAALGHHGISGLYAVSFRYMSVLMAAGTAVLLVQSAPIMQVWLGSFEQLDLALRLFRILLIVHCLLALTAPAMATARALGRAIPEALVYSIGNTAAVGLALIPGDASDSVIVFGAALVVSSTLHAMWVHLGLNVAWPARGDVVRMVTLGVGALGVGAAMAAAVDALTTSAMVRLVVPTILASLAALGLAAGLGLIGTAERRFVATLLGRATARDGT